MTLSDEAIVGIVTLVIICFPALRFLIKYIRNHHNPLFQPAHEQIRAIIHTRPTEIELAQSRNRPTHLDDGIASLEEGLMYVNVS